MANPKVASNRKVYVGNPQSTPEKAKFIYVGSGVGITVIGPATGIRYVFRAGGAQLDVDARDRQMLANLKLLRQVK